MKRNVKLTVFNKTIHSLSNSPDKQAYILAFCLITDKEELVAQYYFPTLAEEMGLRLTSFKGHSALLHPILLSVIAKTMRSYNISGYLENVLKQAQNEHLE